MVIGLNALWNVLLIIPIRLITLVGAVRKTGPELSDGEILSQCWDSYLNGVLGLIYGDIVS